MGIIRVHGTVFDQVRSPSLPANFSLNGGVIPGFAQGIVGMQPGGIRNIVMIVLLLSTIWTFNDFAIIYILTKGGPGGATMVLPVLTYEIAFGAQRLGEAIAVALYMLPPLAFVIIVLSNYMRKGRTR